MASAERRRVLLAADWYPPAFRAGGPVRSVAHLAAFLAREHDVFVVTGSHDLGSPDPLPGTGCGWQDVDGIRVLRLGPSDRTAARWRALLTEVRPHVLHLNSLFSRDFTLAPLRASRGWAGLARILAPRGMLSPGALAHRPLKKRLFLAWAQRAPRFSGVRWHATSELEAEDIRRHFGRARIDVAPNLAGPPPPPLPPRPAPPWRVVSLGRVHPVKNLAFACDVLAGLGRPVRWDIVGPWEDRAEVARLETAAARAGEAAARVAGEAATRNTGEPAFEVQFHGALAPEAAAAVLREAHFLMMPSVSENFGHAVVEAWAAGCPAFVSEGTPWRGLHEAGEGEVLPLEVERWREATRRWMDAGPEAWAAASVRCAAYRADLDERSGAAAATRRIFSA